MKMHTGWMLMALVGSLASANPSGEAGALHQRPMLTLQHAGCEEWASWTVCHPCPEGNQSRGRQCVGPVDTEEDDDDLEVIDGSWIHNVTRNCTCPSLPIVNETAGCGWGEWSECSCDTHEKKRTSTCDDDDTDEDERIETGACECDAVSYEGQNRLGKTFKIKLDKSKAQEPVRSADRVVIALKRVGNAFPSSNEHRRLADEETCADAFDALVHEANSNKFGQWVANLKGEKAGVFAICIRDLKGVIALFPGQLTIYGPTYVKIDGVSCDVSDSQLDVQSTSPIEVEIVGSHLDHLKSWGVVSADGQCPPQNWVDAGSRSGSASQVGKIKVCVLFDGVWSTLGTCARSVAMDDAVAAQSANSTPWAAIGATVGTVAVVAALSVWGFSAYRAHKRRRDMEVIFDVMPDPNQKDGTGVEGTPANGLTSGSATCGTTRGTNTPALRSGMTSGFQSPSGNHTRNGPNTPALKSGMASGMTSGFQSPSGNQARNGPNTPALRSGMASGMTSGYQSPSGLRSRNAQSPLKANPLRPPSTTRAPAPSPKRVGGSTLATPVALSIRSSPAGLEIPRVSPSRNPFMEEDTCLSPTAASEQLEDATSPLSPTRGPNRRWPDTIPAPVRQ